MDAISIVIKDPENNNLGRHSVFDIKPNKQQTRRILQELNEPSIQIEKLLKYLYLFYEYIGVHDFIINKLYNYSEAELNFFMTQLCYLCIQRGSQSLEKFLVDKCATSASFYFLVRSIVDAYSVNIKLDVDEQRNLQKFKEDVEKSYVNGISCRSCFYLKENRPTQEIINQANEKGARIDYIKLNDSFLGNMVNYSLLLKGIEKPDQKAKLKEFMDNENFWIINTLRKVNTDTQYEGITIPFRRPLKSKYSSNLVVKIISDEVTCFNTRTRVPYRVAIETIDIEELKINGRTNRESNSDLQATQLLNQQNSKIKQLVARLAQAVKAQTPSQNNKQNKYNDNLVVLLEQEKKKEEEEQKKEEMLKTQGIKYFKKTSMNYQEPETRSRKEILKESKQKFNEKFPPKKLLRSTSQGILEAQKIQKFKNAIKAAFFKAKNKKRSKSVRGIKHEELISNLKTMTNSKKLNFKQVQKIQDIIAHIDNKDDIKSMQDIDSEPVRKLEPWGEFWEDKKKLIRAQSEYGKYKSYQCRAVIFKGGDDLRQEILAMQLIYKFQKIFMDAGLKLWLRPYEILVLSASSGILEFLPDTLSIDALKKKVDGFTNLYDFYQDTFGDYFDEAQKNFIESLAGYSIVSYLLQFKDRHNGNILINNEGRLIHIDFGFMFSISPGNMNWENAPFKLTKEYVQLMGGQQSDQYSYYKDLLFMGFQAILEKVEDIIFMVQIMQEDSDLPCFKYFDQQVFRQRFREDLKNNDVGLRQYVEKLVSDSYDNTRTNLYDYFQLKSNGIKP
ncbi:phosphatidylinositol 4-kinase (macronuclear) [Tetrahymena thermophila SB210]|uniref:1-phosphatidylinositol 4-kinase n=1 Tax=Tetrahymena thermophila (strain SB210) TaxID=312017 RepID=I7M900_TETTS|nr:phosphatidylinositol 4-kinase [Tetrahymena thermophila SB210]EAS00372.3 phosphatidylinositol 4-kinase [Tetrahymena thermophila SB210]|eukprot:XP_001020617.3 phosphatidylinositol 4-kinase [Tetrahymena thermophila SB210]